MARGRTGLELLELSGTGWKRPNSLISGVTLMKGSSMVIDSISCNSVIGGVLDLLVRLAAGSKKLGLGEALVLVALLKAFWAEEMLWAEEILIPLLTARLAEK